MREQLIDELIVLTLQICCLLIFFGGIAGLILAFVLG